MTFRVTLWAAVGFLISAGWAVYAFAVGPETLLSQQTLLSIARLSCPALLVADHLHVGISLLSTVASNTVVYGLLGLAVEITRRELQHIR
jgi:uncharacterized membrane protein